MPQAPDRYQPSNPNPTPGMGYSEEPHPFWKALEGVVSGLRGMQMSQGKQPWGMHEPTVTAGAGVGAGLQGAGQVMADPRNAWMGMGPVAGMALMGKGIRGAVQKGVPSMGGGANVPTSTMRQAMDLPRENLRQGEIPGGHEAGVRRLYLGAVEGMNDAGSILADPRHPDHMVARKLWDSMSDEEKQMYVKANQGQQALQQEVLKASQGTGGGEMPPSFLGYMPDRASEWGHAPGGLYHPQDIRTAKLQAAIDEARRQRGGGPPQ